MSGIYARSATTRKRSEDDYGIQRRHEEDRSKEIAKFVNYGYPWSELTQDKRESGEYNDLLKPGWLPTAIVVNILVSGDERRGKTISDSELIKVDDKGAACAEIIFPAGFKAGWQYSSIAPIEVIDGQHRLWAFDETNNSTDFQLPVVAFVGLDLSWQAYLFYTINIKPKKINASLAFDLYPMLRAEEWLTKFEGHIIYREARAQEIVDLLCAYKGSPWYNRINMLGESGYKGKKVTQAAWIRALLSTYIKSWEGKGIKLGGLFGAPVGSHKEVLPWNRYQQTAFLIVIGSCLQEAVKDLNEAWTKALRKNNNQDLLDESDDAAFFGVNSLLNQDQGIRAFLHLSNDFIYSLSDTFHLENLFTDGKSQNAEDSIKISDAIKEVHKNKELTQFLKSFCVELAKFDWRASSAPGLNEQESSIKAAYRGSGGYKELRKAVMRHLTNSGNKIVSGEAKKINITPGYK